MVHGPGHFLGSAQTLELMQREYLYPEIGDRDTPDNWLDAGGRDAAAVAHDYAKNVMATHHPSHVPPDREAAARERWDLAVRVPRGTAP